MKMSVDIYQKGDHQKRIQLIKNQLLDQSSTWFKSKNLFKYGAVHMAKGESFLTIFDVGNLVANVSDANFQNSYHIMIIGESGMRGAPFEFFPPTSIDVNNGLLKSFVHFFDITQGDDWHVFNLVPLRKALEDDRLKLADINLIRLIKGYDSLVIIPEVTPAKH